MFPISPPKANHLVGAIAWGRSQTSSYLFASSEPPNTADHLGAHRALDIHEAKTAYNFSAREAGDAMTVDYLGKFNHVRMAQKTELIQFVRPAIGSLHPGSIGVKYTTHI